MCIMTFVSLVYFKAILLLTLVVRDRPFWYFLTFCKKNFVLNKAHFVLLKNIKFDYFLFEQENDIVVDLTNSMHI